MVSHDVRLPLVAIKGFSEVVLAAEQMLEDTLTAAALPGGGVAPRPSAVPLVAAARGVVDHLPTDRGVFTIRGPEDLAAQVDRGHLMQVMTNLLTNAVKYGAPPIVVECVPSGAAVSGSA